jgi:hypothetical protein
MLTLFLVCTHNSECRCILLTRFTDSEIEVLAKITKLKQTMSFAKTPLMLQMNERLKTRNFDVCFTV